MKKPPWGGFLATDWTGGYIATRRACMNLALQ